MAKWILIIIILIPLLYTFLFETYNACGCGCCGSNSFAIPQFTWEPKEIMAKDVDARSEEICKFVGCTKGVNYIYFKFLR
jgi:hypothetical protein